MSRRLVRRLIAFLLAFAVPLHGFAGWSAEPCKATDGEHAQHTHSSGGHSQSDADHSSGKAHCAMCVGCCAGVAIPFFVSALIADGHAESPLAAPAPSLAGIQPEQLDRPPRPFLA